jgi:hypothetical protein
MRKSLLILASVVFFLGAAGMAFEKEVIVPEIVPDPEPSTIVLLGICLVGLAWVEVKCRKKKIDVDNIKRSLVTKIERLNRHLHSS